MHVMAFVNQKGGCGKTTTSINLAGALASRGKRVLLVDLDPQAHATLGLGCAAGAGDPTVLGALTGKQTLDQITVPVPGDFYLAPAAEDLAEFEETVERMVRPERMLARALDGAASKYDHVILDCPARADGVLTANALRACDTAFLIVECSAFALQGAVKALRIFAKMTESMGRDLSVRVVGTMFDKRTKFARELLIAMQARFGPALFDTVIRNSVRLREAAACGVPVQVLDAASRATGEFDALAGEVLQHIEFSAENPIPLAALN